MQFGAVETILRGGTTSYRRLFGFVVGLAAAVPADAAQHAGDERDQQQDDDDHEHPEMLLPYRRPVVHVSRRLHVRRKSRVNTGDRVAGLSAHTNTRQLISYDGLTSGPFTPRAQRSGVNTRVV